MYAMIACLLQLANLRFTLPSKYPSTIQSTPTIRITMLPSLNWVIWALTLPLSMAVRSSRPVKWEDLMIATSEFPRYFGEVTTVPRTGPPKVAWMRINSGSFERVSCVSSPGHVECDKSQAWKVSEELYPAIGEVQDHSPPYLNDLGFLAYIIYSSHGENGTTYRTFVFNQTSLDDMVVIDNTIVNIWLVSQ